MRDFTDKVAVITGGASGVGRSLAFALGRRGAKIAVGDVDKNAMARVREDLAAEGIDCIVEFCDVTSVQSLTDLADKTEAAFGTHRPGVRQCRHRRGRDPARCGITRKRTGSGASTSTCGA